MDTGQLYLHKYNGQWLSYQQTEKSYFVLLTFSMESQESPLFNYMLPVKILSAIPKPWQVEHEINNKISVKFFWQFLPTSYC